jgi:hypothetical protein
MTPDEVASQVAALPECHGEPDSQLYKKYPTTTPPHGGFRLAPPCPGAHADAYQYTVTLAGDETYKGTVVYEDTRGGEELTFQTDMEGGRVFKFGGNGFYPMHAINTGAGDLFNLPALQGKGLNCWVAQATVRVFMVVENREENSLEGDYLTEFAVPEVGEFQPCQGRQGPQTPAGAKEAHVVQQGPLKVYKEATEHAAAKQLVARRGDLVWLYETSNDWTFIRYVGKETTDAPEEGELLGGWVQKRRLDELVRVGP